MLRQSATPWSTQWEGWTVVARSASKMRPTPMAFRRAWVTYTGVRNVFVSFNLLSSIGIIWSMGSSTTKILGSFTQTQRWVFVRRIHIIFSSFHFVGVTPLYLMDLRDNKGNFRGYISQYIFKVYSISQNVFLKSYLLLRTS